MPRRATSSPSKRRPAASPKKPTIRAVAERAHVAISTVSRVLNGGPASERLSRKVRKAVDELGYVPSVAAQSLVGRRAGCIGLVINSTQSAWFTQILQGVEEGLAPSRKSVLLATVMLNGEYDPSQVQGWIHQARVDGMVMVRYAQRSEELLESAKAARLPVVLLAPDRDASDTLSVRCNNMEAGRAAGIHLADLGHKSFVFAGGPRDSVDTRMRLVGLEEALSERGITIPPSQIWFAQSYAFPCGVTYGQRYLELPAKNRPTAVVLGNDTMAVGFLREMMANGVRVPDDVSVVGFDGTPDGERCYPGLTTVEQPTRQMAEFACKALLRCIEDPNVELGTSTEFPVRIIVRESTAAPAR